MVVTDRMSTQTCPICGACQQEDIKQTCDECGWPLDSTNIAARERWARDLWQRSQASLTVVARLEASVTRLEAAIAELPASPTANPAIASPETVPEPEPDGLPLYSDIGLDYVPLAWALSEANWREANALTGTLIDEAIEFGRLAKLETTDLTLSRPRFSAESILEDIARFPATDLQTLAWLWAAYSEGRFGLVAQTSQWAGDYAEFCDRVGWRDFRGWKYLDALHFAPESLETVPIGHLPVLAWRKRACYGIDGQTAASVMAAWFDRWQQVSPNGKAG